MQTIVTLTEKNGVDIQKLFMSCSDYFTQFEKRPVRDQEAEYFLKEVPEGVPLDFKKTFGIFQEDELIALIDWICNYSEEKTGFVGILLVHPKFRERGLAKRILLETRDLLNIDKICIYVEQKNKVAVDFWHTLGFNDLRFFQKDVLGENVDFIEMRF